jgi:phosphatidylglycerophosphate synthase
VTLQRVREVARKRPEQEFALNRLYGAHLSPYFTLLCLRLGLSPDQVTLLGAAVGALGAGLLFLPLGWWSAAAVVALQVGYVLDFSDGQVARFTGRSSVAGSYLDWLTHFYVPVLTALGVAASLAWSTQQFAFLALGALAALELAAFTFSCKEHVLIAMQRDDPGLAATAPFQAALRDDARPADVVAARVSSALSEDQGGIAGRAHGRSLRSLIGELLIYPGSVHLVTLAVLLDLAVGLLLPSDAFPARGVLLGLWAVAFPVHLVLSARRNHALIRAVEARRDADG